jgi:hypothetical protein
VVQLGRIRFLVNSAPVKQLLLNEMLSRAIKCSLRLMLRRKMEQTTLPSEEPYRRELIEYFNLVLGKRPESDHFWKVEIKVMQLSQSVSTVLAEISHALFPLLCAIIVVVIAIVITTSAC